MAFVLTLEVFSLLVLRPLFGTNSPAHLFLLFLILITGLLPFSFWVFTVIDRQQRDLARSAHLLSSVQDYAIFMLDPEGRVMTWSAGAQNVKGYDADEIIGKPLSTFYTSEDIEHGTPARVLAETARLGQFEAEGWRVRKDGSRFWANVVSTLVLDQNGSVLGFTHVARDITEHRETEERIQRLNERLEAWSRELEIKVAERTREIERYSQELTMRVLQAQEEERKRVARELHDDTAQSLSTLLINLDLLEPFVPVDAHGLRSGLDRIHGLTTRILESVRTLSHDLRPTILDDFGLAAALRWHADEHEGRFGVHVDLEIEDSPEPLTPEVELALFRIAQEALTNSGKHAGATRAHLALTFPDSRAILSVADNGKGFDRQRVSSPNPQGGLGLYGMQERASLLGASLEIDTLAGGGTRITVSVPLPPDAEPSLSSSSSLGTEALVR